MKPAFELHRNVNQRQKKPHSVLVFPVYKGRLVFVCHPRRGWEVPGGKIEIGELPEEAVHREAYEEAGVQLERLRWLAEYQFEVNGCTHSKWVYKACVSDIGPRPSISEMVDVCAFDPVLTPDDVRSKRNFSPIMQDAVFEYVWQDILADLDVGSESGPCS